MRKGLFFNKKWDLNSNNFFLFYFNDFEKNQQAFRQIQSTNQNINLLLYDRRRKNHEMSFFQEK